MLLVDASIELADGLTREGVRPKDADDLIAAAALDVRPEYVRDLKSEALVLTDVEDAIACKALGVDGAYVRGLAAQRLARSEEHTSELQSLMRTSYAVFCLKKQIHQQHQSPSIRSILTPYTPTTISSNFTSISHIYYNAIT